MIPKLIMNMRVGSIKKGVPENSSIYFRTLSQPIVGAVRATGVASTLARSRGKL
jgi:hypothetical protein